MGTAQSRRECSIDQQPPNRRHSTCFDQSSASSSASSSARDYDETNSFSEQYDTLRLAQQDPYTGMASTSRFGFKAPASRIATAAAAKSTSCIDKSRTTPVVKSISVPGSSSNRTSTTTTTTAYGKDRKEKKPSSSVSSVKPGYEAPIKRPLFDRLRQSFHKRPVSAPRMCNSAPSSTSSYSSRVGATRGKGATGLPPPSVKQRPLPQSKTVDNVGVTHRRAPPLISKSKTIDYSLAIYEDYEDVFVPIGTEGYSELESRKEKPAPLAKSDESTPSQAFTAMSVSELPTAAEKDRIKEERRLKRSSTLSVEDEQTVNMNMYQHRHLVQDTIEIKTSLMKLKRLLQQDEDELNNGAYELQIKDLQEENESLKKSIQILESSNSSSSCKDTPLLVEQATQTDIIKPMLISKLKKPSVSRIGGKLS